MKKSKTTLKTYNPATASVIIRIGLAIVFAYAAINAFQEPAAWIGFIPGFSSQFIDPKVALDLISVTQLGLAIWLITGKYVKYSAAISVALLGGIMIFNPDTFLITFRDIGLIAAAVALIFLKD